MIPLLKADLFLLLLLFSFLFLPLRLGFSHRDNGSILALMDTLHRGKS